MVAAILTSLVLAQEPVPAFEWHSDPAVALPEGSMQIHDDACFGLFMELELPPVGPMACYLVLSDEGALDTVTSAFASAGYELVSSDGDEGDRVDLVFRHQGTGVEESVTLLYSDGSVFLVGY